MTRQAWKSLKFVRSNAPLGGREMAFVVFELDPFPVLISGGSVVLFLEATPGAANCLVDCGQNGTDSPLIKGRRGSERALERLGRPTHY